MEAQQLATQAKQRINTRLSNRIYWLRWVVPALTVVVLAMFIWAVSPVAAIAAITIFLLVAVFRGFRGNEMDGIENVVGKIAPHGNYPASQP
ncbi:MAG: hypothetical protein OXC72_11710 [Roseovarius sp.]|nr:hypothetical protein [Roseovarius sp.]MCY4316332.1 hypothetical protein [Roseovarius sp.]